MIDLEIICLLCIIAIIFTATFAICMTSCAHRTSISGGGYPSGNKNDLIVDTLNILHYIGLKPNDKSIRRTIEKTLPIIREKYSGHIFYVVKDRDTAFISEETKSMYEELANKHKITIASVEKYKKQPNADDLVADKKNKDHAAKGRDDFYTLFLANKYNCWVLTNDRYVDAGDFKRNLIPFHVYVYTYFKKRPEHVIIEPKGERLKLSKTRRIKPAIIGIYPPSKTTKI